MRSLFVSLIVLGLSVCAFSGYDYQISSGFFGNLTIENEQTLLMTGGGGARLTGQDNSILDIKNTSPLAVLSGGIWDLVIHDNSKLLLSGGHINRLDIGEDAAALLSGGQINKIISGYSFANPLHIKIICQTAVYDSTTKYLNGVWKDGSTFSIFFEDRSGYSSIVNNITIIPEPTTMLLLGLGGVLLRRRQ